MKVMCGCFRPLTSFGDLQRYALHCVPHWLTKLCEHKFHYTEGTIFYVINRTIPLSTPTNWCCIFRWYNENPMTWSRRCVMGTENKQKWFNRGSLVSLVIQSQECEAEWHGCQRKEKIRILFSPDFPPPCLLPQFPLSPGWSHLYMP